jgi:protein arginine kinase activator
MLYRVDIMLCQNCGKNEANIRYTQIINGVKKEVALCSDCARKLGLENIGIPDLSMNFHSILGDFFNDYAESMLLPSIENNTIKCKKMWNVI